MRGSSLSKAWGTLNSEELLKQNKVTQLHAPPPWDITPFLEFISESQFSAVLNVHFSSGKKKKKKSGFKVTAENKGCPELCTHSEIFHDEFIHYSHSKLQEFNNFTSKLAELTAIHFFLPPKILKSSSRFKLIWILSNLYTVKKFLVLFLQEEGRHQPAIVGLYSLFAV